MWSLYAKQGNGMESCGYKKLEQNQGKWPVDLHEGHFKDERGSNQAHYRGHQRQIGKKWHNQKVALHEVHSIVLAWHWAIAGKIVHNDIRQLHEHSKTDNNSQQYKLKQSYKPSVDMDTKVNQYRCVLSRTYEKTVDSWYFGLCRNVL